MDGVEYYDAVDSSTLAHPKYAKSSLITEVLKMSVPVERLSTRVKSVRFTFTTMPEEVRVLFMEYRHAFEEG